MSGAETAAHFVLRRAKVDEAEIVQKVVASSFRMDAGWSSVQTFLTERLQKDVARVFEDEEKARNCVVLLHGGRIIGASVLDTAEAAASHLATGPCILHEYRSRGHGSLLLKASLDALQEAGLAEAFGVAADKTTAARFVYPKFGGTATPWTPDFVIAPKLAA